jgi:hypothetical protein
MYFSSGYPIETHGVSVKHTYSFTVSEAFRGKIQRGVNECCYELD